MRDCPRWVEGIPVEGGEIWGQCGGLKEEGCCGSGGWMTDVSGSVRLVARRAGSSVRTHVLPSVQKTNNGDKCSRFILSNHCPEFIIGTQ